MVHCALIIAKTRASPQNSAKSATGAAQGRETTLNHTMRLDDPLELFPTFITEAGV
jgi:hypothetical protein